MTVMPGREDEDATKNIPPTNGKPEPAAPPATWSQRNAQREEHRRDAAAAKTAMMAALPPVAPPPPPREPVLRVHIEEMREDVSRPELLSGPRGQTVFDATGPREVVATSLRAMANKFDPPWWAFWAHLRRR